MFPSIPDSEGDAKEYMEKCRSILPAIYNANLVKYDWMPTDYSVDEQANQIACVKLENEVKRLKAENQRILNEMIGVADLEPDKLEFLQEFVMDDEIECIAIMPPPIKFKQEVIDDVAIGNENFRSFNETRTNGTNVELHEIVNSNVLINETNGEFGADANLSNNGDIIIPLTSGKERNTRSRACSLVLDPVAGTINVIIDVIQLISIHCDHLPLIYT